MKHLQAYQCLLVATLVSLTSAANYQDTFYTVDKEVNKEFTTVKVIGQGISYTFTFTPEEDQTVYKTDDELVIGKTVYINNDAGYFSQYFATVVEGDKCSKKTFGFGKLIYSSSVDCNPIISKIENVRKTLFETRFNNDYDSKMYTVNKKENGKGATVQVIGRGIEDQFVFNSKNDAVVYKRDTALVVGDKLFSDTANSIVVVEKGKCTEKGYEMGKIIQENPLTQVRCTKVIADMKEAKKVNSDLNFENDRVSGNLEPVTEELSEIQSSPPEAIQPINSVPPSVTDSEVNNDIQLGFLLHDSTDKEGSNIAFSNDKVDRYSPSFTVDQVDDGKGTVVQVVGKGIIDRFAFTPEEDINVRKTDKVLVIGDKLYTDKENAITVVYGRMCVERIYKKSKKTGRELSNKECDSVVNNIKKAKVSIPSENGKNDFDDRTFKVSVDVIGNGIKDKFRLPYLSETKIFNKDSTLVIGETIYINKPNTLIEIEGENCKERKYTQGYMSSEADLLGERCEEVKKDIAAVTFSGAPLGNFAKDSENNNDFEAPHFSVKKARFSEFYTRIDVIGNGVKDKFFIPFNHDSSVYDNGNVLIIGERLYTDKPNSLVEIYKGKCMEFKYEDGRRVGAEVLNKHDCNEIKLKMSLVSKLVLDDTNKVGKGDNENDGKKKLDKAEEARIIAEYVESLPDWLQDMISTIPSSKKETFFSRLGL